MNRRSAKLFTCVLTSTAALIPSSFAAHPQGAEPPHYEVHELGQSSWGLTIPNDINNRGVIVGEWDSGDTFGEPRHAVAWIDGQMLDLTTDDAIATATARSVNDDGLIVGRFITNGAYPSGAFSWQAGGYQVLPTFAVGHQAASGVSESGLILGRAMHENFHVNATVWTRGLVDTDLGGLGQGLGMAYDANGWDFIVGSSSVSFEQIDAFMWRNGEMHSLGSLPGSPFTGARAINNYNEVVGYSGAALNDHAFYWSQTTGMIDLGNLGYSYGASANDINDAGVIVGYTYGPSGRIGAVWHDFVLHDLNTLLVNGQGWELYDANGLNELGQIVGMGRRNGGTPVGYLLTPVDAPMTTIIGPTPGRAGEINTIEIVEATPNAEVRVFYGAAQGSHPVGGCSTAVVDIAAPSSVAVRTDGDGRAIARFDIPASASGKRRFFQAVDVSTCDTTNLIVRRMN
jgi:probable HAF family extracellular repeat protein